MLWGSCHDEVRRSVLADLHLIQRSGDRADTVLGQHKAQEPREFLAVQLTVSEDLHKLIQHITQDLP